MRRFQVMVNGASYDVEIEEITDGAQPLNAPAPAPAAQPAAPAVQPAAPKPAAPAAPKPAAPKPVQAGGTVVSSPMPGTILDIKCTVGAPCKKGDVLLILEAMKMENEITSPQDGVINQVAVSKGASVSTGDTLIVIG